MKKFVTAILTLALCIGISGCSVLNTKIENQRSNRKYCTLNKNNATIFTYDGTDYVILEDTVERNTLGAWVGYIQKLAILDKQNAVLELRELNLSDSKKKAPNEAAYVIQFLNIYKDNKNEQGLIIDVENGFHKAIPKAQAGNAKIISFEELHDEQDEQITIDPNNCTQIIYKNKIYKITNNKISEDKIQAYLGLIGTSKVFDSRTNKEIPKSVLKDIDITPSELSKQKRVSWTYGTVFSISDTDKNSSIAVEINSQYLRADMVK